MAKKRDRLEIIHDILLAIKERNGKIRITNIMYKANLSFYGMLDYMKELLEKKFIAENCRDKSAKTYSITEEGMRFLSKYHEIKDFVDSFGL
jgi:predicted transcriptional regulator